MNIKMRKLRLTRGNCSGSLNDRESGLRCAASGVRKTAAGRGLKPLNALNAVFLTHIFAVLWKNCVFPSFKTAKTSVT